MPRVTIRTGFAGRDGREEMLSEYQCDIPDCPNVATHVIGSSRELRMSFAVCEEHRVKKPAPSES
jgi:hypothetical protein